MRQRKLSITKPLHSTSQNFLTHYLTQSNAQNHKIVSHANDMKSNSVYNLSINVFQAIIDCFI